MICGRTLIPLNPRIPTLPRKCQASFGVSLTEDGAQPAVANSAASGQLQQPRIPRESGVWTAARGECGVVQQEAWSLSLGGLLPRTGSSRQLSAWGRFQVPSGVIWGESRLRAPRNPGEKTMGCVSLVTRIICSGLGGPKEGLIGQRWTEGTRGE
jgi:hypothetical protein